MSFICRMGMRMQFGGTLALGNPYKPGARGPQADLLNCKNRPEWGRRDTVQGRLRRAQSGVPQCSQPRYHASKCYGYDPHEFNFNAGSQDKLKMKLYMKRGGLAVSDITQGPSPERALPFEPCSRGQGEGAGPRQTRADAPTHQLLSVTACPLARNPEL